MHTSTDLPPPSDRDAGTVAGTYASADSGGNAGGAATATMTRPYAADDGLFDDHSMIRRVHRERIVALHGPRTLLMQASHPLAFVGFWWAVVRWMDRRGALGGLPAQQPAVEAPPAEPREEAAPEAATWLGGLLARRGDADALICGLEGRFDRHLREQTVGEIAPDRALAQPLLCQRLAERLLAERPLLGLHRRPDESECGHRSRHSPGA